MDTAQEVNNHRTGSGIFRHAFAEEPVSQQYAKAGAGICFEQEEHGLTKFFGLLNAQRREHSMIDGVVEEQNLSGFNDNGCQR